MVNKEILIYISAEMDRGITREAIEKNLKDNGWNDADLKEAFALVSSVNSVSPSSSSVLKNMTEKETPPNIPNSSVNSSFVDTSGVKTTSRETTGVTGNPIHPTEPVVRTENSPSSSTPNKIPESKPLSAFTTMQSQTGQSYSPQINMGEMPSTQNFANIKTVTRESISGGFMGYVWVALIFLLLGGGGGFYISNKFFSSLPPLEEDTPSLAQPIIPVKNVIEKPTAISPIPESDQTNVNATTTDGILCAQVITKAKDPKTKVIKEFATPCEVPSGWEIVSSASTSLQTATTSQKK